MAQSASRQKTLQRYKTATREDVFDTFLCSFLAMFLFGEFCHDVTSSMTNNAPQLVDCLANCHHVVWDDLHLVGHHGPFDSVVVVALHCHQHHRSARERESAAESVTSSRHRLDNHPPFQDCLQCVLLSLQLTENLADTDGLLLLSNVQMHCVLCRHCWIP